MSALALSVAVACNETETIERTHSTPVIGAANVTPVSFTYGDSITLTASVSDPVNEVSVVTATVVVSNMIVAEQEVYKWTNASHGKSAEVSAKIYIPFVKNMQNAADAKVLLSVKNTSLDEGSREVTGLMGMRRYFSDGLLLVLDGGEVHKLAQVIGEPDKYKVEGLSLPNSISYKIAVDTTSDGSPDYSQFVWGSVSNAISITDASGGNIAYANPLLKNITTIEFDAMAFAAAVEGEPLTPISSVGTFSESSLAANQTIDQEAFKVGEFYIEKNLELTLGGELASADVVFNVDFFDRTAADKVKFLGETGPYTLYYNAVRKYVLVGVPEPAYPDYIVAPGTGIGYPTKITEAALQVTYSGHKLTTFEQWGFDNILRYVLFRRIGNDIYQGTMLLPGSAEGWDVYSGFKLHYATDWSGEHGVSDITGGFSGNATDIINEITTNNTGDWQIKTAMPHACYRFTVDMTAKTVKIDTYTLP
jgi:hypothetical protein